MFQEPEIIYRRGKPAAVILKIAVYESLLEKLEDEYDLKRIRALKRRPHKEISLEDVLAKRSHRAV